VCAGFPTVTSQRIPDSLSSTTMTCPLCGSKELAYRFTAHDYLVTGDPFSVLFCPTCDLGVTDPRPPLHQMDQYYQSEAYISHAGSSRGLMERVYFLARRMTIAWKCRLVRRASKKRGSILDVGCGSGAFLSGMQRRGWRVLGIEPNDKARQIAIRDRALDAREPSALESLPSDSVDVITLWHVLEHMSDFRKALKDCLRLLKPDGKILIAVPNHRSSDAEYYGPDWAAAMALLFRQQSLDLMGKRFLPLDGFYIALLSDGNRQTRCKIFHALWIGLRSFAQSLFHVDQASSVLFIGQKKEQSGRLFQLTLKN